MSVATKEGKGGNGDPPEVNLLATGDPRPSRRPFILNNAYFELGGVNLRCTVKHLEACFAENKLVTITSFCSETDYPGVTKYHLRATFNQDFSTGSVFATLNAAVLAYQANQTPVNFKARPYASTVTSSTNPQISGMVIPQPFTFMLGDASTTSEVQIDWSTVNPAHRIRLRGGRRRRGRRRRPRVLRPVGGEPAGQPGRPDRRHRHPGHRVGDRSVRHHRRPAGRPLVRFGVGGR